VNRWIGVAILPLALWACEASEPTVAAVPPERAAALYLEHCAICHGEAGDGRGPRRGSLHERPTDFRRKDWRDGRTLAELRKVIREGRPGTDMPAWRTLPDADIAGLAEYVLSLGAAPSARTER